MSNLCEYSIFDENARYQRQMDNVICEQEGKAGNGSIKFYILWLIPASLAYQ